MKIVAVTRILDEADIVEAFVRHTAAHVGHHLLLDNGSRDGTREILLQLRDEGLPLTLLATASVAFKEEAAMTFLFREAVATHGADWVICLDADEFIDDRQAPGGLVGLLAGWSAMPEPPLQLRVALSEYIAIVHDVAAEVCVPRRIQWRAERSNNLKTVVSGRLGVDGITVEAGGHGAVWTGSGAQLRPMVLEQRLSYAHYSERDSWQWITKFVRGWAKVLASGAENERLGRSDHYGAAFRVLRDTPERILLNGPMMAFKNERPGLIHDAIDYRGGPLRYFRFEDARARAARVLAGYVEDLARRHGRLLDAVPQARLIEEAWDEIGALPPTPPGP